MDAQERLSQQDVGDSDAEDEVPLLIAEGEALSAAPNQEVKRGRKT